MRVIAIFFLLICPWIINAQSSGPNHSSNVYDGGGGVILQTWSNPNNARTQNDVYASMTTTEKNKATSYLMAQNFGFSIPTGASITGIVVEIERYATATMSGSVSDYYIQLIDATNSINGDNKAYAPAWPGSDTDTYQTYGGASDTWGITGWTSAKINSSNFGVAIAAQTSNTNSATFNMFVDDIRITVYYTAGGAQRYAVASGNWSSTTSWATTPGGTPGAAVPTASNDVFIGGGFTITQNVNTGGGAYCNSLTIGTSQATPAGILTFNGNDRHISIGSGGLVITSDGNVTGSNTPTLTTAGDLTLNAVLSNRAFTITINGTGEEIISGTGTLGILNVLSYTTNTGNLTISGRMTGTASRLINGSTGYIKYSGNTGNAGSNVLDLTTVGNTIEYAQTTTDAVDFNLQKPSTAYYHLIISGNAPKYYNGAVTINGNLTIASGGVLSNQSGETLTLYGNWTNNNGAAGFLPNSTPNSLVIFTGGSAQTITNSAGAQTFYKVQVNKTSGTTLTASNNVTVNNLLTMTSGNFDVGSNSLSGGAALTFNGGELLIGTTGTTVPELTGTYTLNAGTVTFNGAGGQTIRSSASSPAVASYINVQFLGSGTKSLSGAITVSTSLIIGGTASLDVTASNYGITLAGNWTNTSTFTARSGTVTLNGISTQTVTNASGEIFNNLTVNNSTSSSAIVFGGPATVNGTMTFTDGHVITTSSNLLTLGAGASVASVSDGSHVDGPVAKIKNTTTKFDFPIGDGINYMPASVTPTSTSATTFVAEYFSIEQTLGTTLGAGVDHISSQDYWFINRSSGSANANVTLVWEYPSAADSEINNLGQLLVAQWNGTQWTNQGNTATSGAAAAGSVTSNAISSFTQPYFVIGSSTTNNPLSNNRYFVAATGNWDGGAVWAYRSGGTANASPPTSTKNAIIESGNTCTILDATAGQANVNALSLTIFGTLNMANAVPATNVNVNVGTGGLVLGANSNITGSGNDFILAGGNIALNNTSTPSHSLLEVNFSSQGHTISGTGSLLFLHVTSDNQVNAGTVSFTNLDVDNSITNNGTITVTGAFSGGGTMTNAATGTFIWQGTSVNNRVIDASAPGNTISLINNSIANLDIGDFVTANTYHHLTLSGPNEYRTGGNMDINGDLTISSGSVLNNSPGNNRINIGGNWTNNNGAGGFLNGTNDITFDGSSQQSIFTSSGNEVFARMVINNTSSTGVTITSGEVHVTSALTLTDGIVFTDATRLLVLEDNVTSSTGSASTYVDGPMKKIGDDAFTFPVGDGATWARLRMETLASYGTDTEFTCQYFHSSYSNTTSLDATVTNVSTIEYWTLDRTFDVGSNASCLVRLYWENESASGIQDLPDLRVGHFYNGAGGTKWYSFGGTVTDNGNGSGSIVSTMTFTSFSPITFASAFGFNPLPVELLSFTAEAQENDVALEWSTASELNNDHFTLERSYNGLDFIAFADVPGNGTSKIRKDYTALDTKPYGGLSYYRLSQVDFDGVRTYLDVVAIRRPSSAWSVYPNPFNGSNLHFQVPENRGTRAFLLTITNTQGSIVFNREIIPTLDSQIDVNLDSSLAAGVYILTITDGLNREIRRMIVTK